MERNCEIEKIGGLIDNKGYGIALPRSESKLTHTKCRIYDVILMLEKKNISKVTQSSHSIMRQELYHTSD